MPTFDEWAKEQGLEDIASEPVVKPPEPMSTVDWVKGHLYLGTEHAMKRLANVALPFGGATHEQLMANAEAQKELALPGTFAAAAHELQQRPPDEGVAGFIGSLVQTVPELPAYMIGGAIAGSALKMLETAPYVGKAAGALSRFIAPEAIEKAGTLGFIGRTAAHGATTGATLGLITGAPGERLEAAKEEALGFAQAAPVFGLAGRAIGWGVRKAVGKAFGQSVSPEEFAKMDILKEGGFASMGEARRWAKEEFGDSWSSAVDLVRPQGLRTIYPVKSSSANALLAKSSDLANIPSVDIFEKGQEPTAGETLSGAPKELRTTADGKTVAVANYATDVELPNLDMANERFSQVLTGKSGTLFKTPKQAGAVLDKMTKKGQIDGVAKIVKVGDEGYVLGVTKGPVEEAGVLDTGFAKEVAGGVEGTYLFRGGKEGYWYSTARAQAEGYVTPEGPLQAGILPKGSKLWEVYGKDKGKIDSFIDTHATPTEKAAIANAKDVNEANAVRHAILQREGYVGIDFMQGGIALFAPEKTLTKIPVPKSIPLHEEVAANEPLGTLSAEETSQAMALAAKARARQIANPKMWKDATIGKILQGKDRELWEDLTDRMGVDGYTELQRRIGIQTTSVETVAPKAELAPEVSAAVDNLAKSRVAAALKVEETKVPVPTEVTSEVTPPPKEVPKVEPRPAPPIAPGEMSPAEARTLEIYQEANTRRLAEKGEQLGQFLTKENREELKGLAKELPQGRIGELAALVKGEAPVEVPASNMTKLEIKPLETTTSSPVKEVVVEVDKKGKATARTKTKEPTPERDRFEQELRAIVPGTDREIAMRMTLLDTLADQAVKDGRVPNREAIYRGIEASNEGLMKFNERLREQGKPELAPGTLGAMEHGIGTLEDLSQEAYSTLHLFENSNFSTFAHEIWHFWQERFASNATKEALKGLDEEVIARNFEKFLTGTITAKDLREAKLSSKLLDFFQQAKEWILNIYTSIRGTSIDLPIAPEVEAAFRRELGLKEMSLRDLADLRGNALEKEYNQLMKLGRVEDATSVLRESAALNEWKKDNPAPKVEVAPTTRLRKKAPVSEEGVGQILAMAENTPEEIELKHNAINKVLDKAAGEGTKLPDMLVNHLEDEADRLGDRLLENVPKGEEVVKEFAQDVKAAKNALTDTKIEEIQVKGKEKKQAAALDQITAKTKKVETVLKQEGGEKVKDFMKDFKVELARMPNTAAELRDMSAAWQFPAEEVTMVIPRTRLEKFARDLGMAKELELAQKSGTTMKPYVDPDGNKFSSFYAKVYMTLQQSIGKYRDPQFEGKSIRLGQDKAELAPKNVPLMTEMMKRISDEVHDWWVLFKTQRPHMLKEAPAASAYKAALQFIEDKLGFSKSSLDRWMWRLYEKQATIQHVAMRAPVTSGAFELEVKRQNIGSHAMKDILHGVPESMGPPAEGEVERRMPGFAAVRNPITGKLDKVERWYSSPGINGYLQLHDYDAKMGKVASEILWKYSNRTDAPRITPEMALSAAEKFGYKGADAERIVKAVMDVRDTLDYVYFSIRKDFKDRLPTSMSSKDVEKAMKQFDRDHPYRQNYAPRVREGDMVVAAFNNTTGEAEYHSMGFGGRWATAERAKVEEMYKGPQYRVAEFPATSAEARRSGLGTAQAQSLIQRVAELATTDRLKLDDQVAKLRMKITENMPPLEAAKINNEIALITKEFEQNVQDHFLKIGNEYLKGMGIRGHFIPREKPEGVPGYVTDLRKALLSYTEMYASYMGRQHFMRGIYDELGKLKGYGVWQQYVRDWAQLAMQAPTRADAVLGAVKQVAALKFLTSPKTALVVTLDKLTNVLPMMQMYAKEGRANQLFTGGIKDGTEFVLWTKRVDKQLKALREEAGRTGVEFNERQVLRELREKNPLPASISKEEQHAMLTLERNGFLDPFFTRVIVDDMKSDIDALAPANRMAMDAMINRNFKKLSYYSTWAIGNMESLGRTSTALSAYRMFREVGLSAEEAITAAGRFTIDSHGYYNKHNVPLSMMEGFGKALKLPYTFRVFEHHYIQLMTELLSIHGNVGKAVAAKSLGMLAALGGVFALPFMPSLQKLSKWATGTDPEMALRKVLSDYTGSEKMADIMSYGIPGGVGVPFMAPFNMRSSVEVGNIDWKELVFGAPGQAIQDVAVGAQSAIDGNWDQVANRALPAALANPVKAYQRYYYGMMGPSGEYMKEGVFGEPVKYTVPEMLLQVAGFTPTRVDKIYRQEQALAASGEYWQNKRKVIYGQLERSVNKGDEAGLQKAFEMVDKFNRDAMVASPSGGITLIGPKEIQQSLKDRNLTRKARLALDIGGETWVSGPAPGR